MTQAEVIRAKIKDLTEEEAKLALRVIVGLAEDGGEFGRIFTPQSLNYIVDSAKWGEVR